MAINIKPNTWSEPIEVREHVVQDICDAFLNHCAWSTFHPKSDGVYRNATLCVLKHKGSNKAYGFNDKPFNSDNYETIRGCEMKAAFQELRKAGYHIFEVHEYGTWRGYKVSCRNYLDGGVEVTEFNDKID